MVILTVFESVSEFKFSSDKVKCCSFEQSLSLSQRQTTSDWLRLPLWFVSQLKR